MAFILQAEEVPDAIPCKNLLDLPREMRDLIYYFAAFYHLRDIGPCKTPGLLRANHQTRTEFSKVVYSTKLLRITKFECQPRRLARARLSKPRTSLVPQPFPHSSIEMDLEHNKAVLEHKYYRTRFFTSRFGCSRSGAQRLLIALEFSHPGHQHMGVFSTLELVGTGGKYCAVVDVPYMAMMDRSFDNLHRRL